jgi:hypothetical protein
MLVARNTCASCIHYRASDNSPLGRCHRYPPVLVPPSQIPHHVTKYTWEWPEVRSSSGCGEYKPLAVVP